MQKFHPILFSTEMVQAIQKGRKTMTRRVIKKSALLTCLEYPAERSLRFPETFCPYGKVGDVLWVRETFNHFPSTKFYYKADGIEGMPADYQQLAIAHNLKFPQDFEWKPSIFMPKSACRIFLKITDIKVERAQDISEEDAKAEGVETLGLYPGYDVSILGKFEGLWVIINGAKSWEANPFVWVISFEQINKPENFL